jgi:hypothetical protein
MQRRKVIPTTTGGQTATVDRATLRANSQYVGKVDDEVTLDVRVNHISGPFASTFGNGDRYLFLLGDGDRNAIRVWSARQFNGPGGFRIVPEKGDRYRIRATVKKHEEFKGEKQTTLAKISVLEKLT